LSVEPEEFQSYVRPPVVEVVFAVSFRSVPLSIVELASFGSSKLIQSYPLVQEQPVMHMPVESFDDGPSGFGSVASFSLLTGPPSPRLWFQSQDRTQLVQLQRDWIAFNWQDTAESPKSYPRYGAIEKAFFDVLESFSEFVSSSNGNPVIQITQCELTYINHVQVDNVWSRHGQLKNVLRTVQSVDDYLPEPEDTQITTRYRMETDGGTPGRLYVNAVPGFRQADKTPMILLTLTARGAPGNRSDKTGALGFFRSAHKWIVEGFTSTTTDDAHLSWGLKNV
jgi:uncharacterized protein (TIGR04255 family)